MQRCPALLSWLQGVVDERQVMGDFIIIGSVRFDFIAAVSQSLAGRVARLELMPLSITEIRAHNDTPRTLGKTLLRGSYPALDAQPVDPPDWFPNYIATYVERDVRQLLAIHDLAKFQIFLKMSAARTGQLLNIAALGID
uniref:AAA family ATPase n=1 Tax=Orrella sp. TaxID=1921583 RepID=UPI004055435F